MSKDFFSLSSETLSSKLTMTGTTRLVFIVFLARHHKQNEFSSTSLRINDTNINGCFTDVIITERQISCIITPMKLSAGIPNKSDPNNSDGIFFENKKDNNKTAEAEKYICYCIVHTTHDHQASYNYYIITHYQHSSILTLMLRGVQFFLKATIQKFKKK